MIIEDYQNELSPHRFEKKNNSKLKVFLVFLGTWVVLAVITLAIFANPIKQTLNQTNAIYILRNVPRLRKKLNLKSAKLCFVNLSSGEPILVTVNTNIEKGGASEYHDVLEGLLSGPGPDALKEGNVSLISENTKLEGFAYSTDICFVCLSPAFLESENLEIAKQQIEKTIKYLNSSLKEVVFVINNQEV